MNNDPKKTLDFDSEIMLQKILGTGTNQNRESILREVERDLLKTATAPIDLRSIPESSRDKHDEDYVIPPKDIQDYLESTTFPLTESEIENLQAKMEAHHAVQPPSYIVLMPDFARTGKNHTYIKELEQYCTGFVYRHG